MLRDADGRPRICEWCPKPIPARSPTGRRTRADATTCGVICRKRRHRFQRAVARGVPLRVTARRDAERLAAGPGRFAYADPPYPGLADYYPEAEEVDHAALIAFLEAEYADGWALSTSARALREVLALCPAQTRVCAWRRRVRFTASRRALSAWEPLLVVRGRELATDRPQELVDDVQTPDVILDEDALDYRGRYDSAHRAMVGMKPPQFAVWMFAQLGARHGDTLDDLYPGSGSIGRAWTLYGALEAADASRLEPAEASRLAAAICPECAGDVGRDRSPRRRRRVPHRHGGPEGQLVTGSTGRGERHARGRVGAGASGIRPLSRAARCCKPRRGFADATLRVPQRSRARSWLP